VHQNKCCVVSTKIRLFGPEKAGGNHFHPSITINCFELCKERNIISSSGAKAEIEVDILSHIFAQQKNNCS